MPKATQRGRRVAYLMSRFPKLTETFVLYELLELERRGLGVEIFPLLRQREKRIHSEAERLLPRVHFLPLLSLMVAGSNLHYLFTRPLRYLRAVGEALLGNLASPGYLARALLILPKSVYIAQRIERLGVAHLHAHFATHATLAALVVHRLTGIPFSFTAHAADIFKDLTLFETKARAAAFVVTISDYNFAYLMERFPSALAGKLHRVRCGVDTGLFRPRARERGDGDPFNILCIASLKEKKGHRHLIDACARLREEGLAFRLQLVGEGPLRQTIEAQIEAAGIAPRVTLHGAQPSARVAELLAEADAVALSSMIDSKGDQEGIPVVLMEALASGRPVVTSRLSGIPELVEDGVTGLLCEPGDVDCLALALRRLAKEPGLAARLGEQGRVRVAAEYDLKVNAERLAALIRGGRPK